MGKAYKWLEETLHNPPYLHLLLKPPKLPSFRPNHRAAGVGCAHQHHHGNNLHRFGGSSNGSSSITNTTNTHSGSGGVIWAPPQRPGTPLVSPYFTKSTRLCSGGDTRDINASLWEHWPERVKEQLQGKWQGAGLGVGLPREEDLLGDTPTNGSSNYYYGQYNYYNHYDYDQEDWLSSRLEEIYRLMRQEQMDNNIALTIFLALVFLLGVTGNLLVLAVFSRPWGVSGPKQQLQASTVFIKALALTDLVICLVVLPGVLLKEWCVPYRWDALCQGWELTRCSTIPLSTLILTSVAVDRYLKICRLHDASWQITPAGARKILLVSVVVSMCAGIPPMLRVGVHQAGDGGGTPSFYLGLCMVNELLVSKATGDCYWRVMSALFLVVLLVVMVMYGMVFRTVYHQGRQWGGGSGVTKSGSSVGGGGAECCEDDGSDGSNNNCVGGEGDGGSGKGGEGYTSDSAGIGLHCGETNCQYYGREEEAKNLSMEGCHDKATRDEERLAAHPNQDLSSPDMGCTTDQKHITRKTATPCWTENINEKKTQQQGTRCFDRKPGIPINDNKNRTVVSQRQRAWSLKFLCKTNNQDSLNTQKLQQNEMDDDGVTSLDDGHVSFYNSAASTQGSSNNSQSVKCRSAIFSCTSKLTVTRSAHISQTFYRTDSLDDGKETDMDKPRVPGWMRKWKRIATAVFFTTAAQREEGKRSAKRLALRQSAKIRMLSQETSGEDNTKWKHMQVSLPRALSPSDAVASDLAVPTNTTSLMDSGQGEVSTVTSVADCKNSQVLMEHPGNNSGKFRDLVISSLEENALQGDDSDLNNSKEGKNYGLVSTENEKLQNRKNMKNQEISLKGADIHLGTQILETCTKQSQVPLYTEKVNGRASNNNLNCCTSQTQMDKDNKDEKEFQPAPKVKSHKESWMSHNKVTWKTSSTPNLARDASVHKAVTTSMSHPLSRMTALWNNKIHPFGQPVLSTSDSNLALSYTYNSCQVNGKDNDTTEWKDSIIKENGTGKKKITSISGENIESCPDYSDYYKYDQATSWHWDFLRRKFQNLYRRKDVCHPGQPQTMTTGPMDTLPYSKSQNAPPPPPLPLPQPHPTLQPEQKLKRGGPARRYYRAQVKTAKVLLLVTVVYVLSFAPCLLMSVGAVPSHPLPFYAYFLHSAANPLLYSFINGAFRTQLYRLVCPRWGQP